MMKSYAYLAVITFGLLTACSKKEDTQPANTTTNLTATINGLQQTPPNNSTATGTFTGVYNSGSQQLTYTVVYQGFTPTVAHIHTGAPGVSGSVAIPFANLTSPITGTVTLTSEQADNLLNNRMYVNMHSMAYGNGEIRGDIHK
jgi:CHRD domain